MDTGIVDSGEEVIATVPKKDVSAKTMTVVSIIVSAILLVAEVGMFCHCWSAIQQIQAGRSRVEQLEDVYAALVRSKEISDAQQGLFAQTKVEIVPSLEAEPRTLPLTEQEAKVQKLAEATPTDSRMDNLVSALAAVTKCQNDYISAVASSDEIKRIAAEMDKYLGPDDLDQRTPWYYGTEEAHWEYVNPLLSYQEQYPVMWLCKDSSGVVVSAASANYDFSIGKFTYVSYTSVDEPTVPDEILPEEPEEEVLNEGL